jgi:serine/threonine protein kinase
VALKIKEIDEIAKIGFESELAFFQEVPEHECLLKLRDFKIEVEFKDPSEEEGSERLVNIFALEYAPNGELYDYLAEYGAFPEPVARWAYKQILSGLEVIHKAGFAHKDLRPENILVAKDFTLKIADFDLSCRLPIRKYSGTPSCLPPELNMRRDFDNV